MNEKERDLSACPLNVIVVYEMKMQMLQDPRENLKCLCTKMSKECQRLIVSWVCSVEIVRVV